MTWEMPIALDLWLAGTAGGAYFAAFLADRFSGRRHKEALKLATYLGMPAAVLGVLLLVVDLGHPLWAWHLFVRFRPLSPMSMGSWILTLWLIVGVALIALWWAEGTKRATGILAQVASRLRPFAPATEVLAWIAFPLAALLMTYTGVLLSTTSQPLWQGTLLLPTLFVASAASTGIAMVIIALPGEYAQAIVQWRKALAVAIVLQLVVLIGFIAWLGPTARTLISGTLGLFLWGGVVIAGLLIPLGLELSALRRKAGVMRAMVLASSVLVLLGGLILRAVVVVGGQI